MAGDDAIEAAATELCLIRMCGCFIPKRLHGWCVRQLAAKNATSWQRAMDDARAAIRAYLAAQPAERTAESMRREVEG